MLQLVQETVDQLIGEFDFIPGERRVVLRELTAFIQSNRSDGKKSYLNFICTHNSRRSHIAQIWAQTAAVYYQIPNVECFSGGTEATAFNPRAVKAMQRAGFAITVTKDGSNPVYRVQFDATSKPIVAFSKTYDDAFNPAHNFAAIMTCSHADENCPIVSGASKRITITYDDPKEFDDEPVEMEMYDERVRQIGMEMLFVFSEVD